jgi:hypothetical protein
MPVIVASASDRVTFVRCYSALFPEHHEDFSRVTRLACVVVREIAW